MIKVGQMIAMYLPVDHLWVEPSETVGIHSFTGWDWLAECPWMHVLLSHSSQK